MKHPGDEPTDLFSCCPGSRLAGWNSHTGVVRGHKGTLFFGPPRCLETSMNCLWVLSLWKLKVKVLFVDALTKGFHTFIFWEDDDLQFAESLVSEWEDSRGPSKFQESGFDNSSQLLHIRLLRFNNCCFEFKYLPLQDAKLKHVFKVKSGCTSRHIKTYIDLSWSFSHLQKDWNLKKAFLINFGPGLRITKVPFHSFLFGTFFGRIFSCSICCIAIHGQDLPVQTSHLLVSKFSYGLLCA